MSTSRHHSARDEQATKHQRARIQGRWFHTVWMSVLASCALVFWACSSPPTGGPGDLLVAEGDLPVPEWIHSGSTWSWGHDLPAGFQWPGPGALRGAWVPSTATSTDRAAEGTANVVGASAPERVRLEPGEAVPSSGHLVAPRRARRSRGAEPRLILWIVADTLRADVADRDLSFRSLFDDGLQFSRAYAPAAWTLPSMASMFTGVVPAALRGPQGELIVLPSVVPTVAERAREQGFVTAAVIANPTVNHDNGFSRGFDRYTVPSYADGWNLPDASWVLEHALRELDTFAGEDLFLLVHFMDAHDPYRDHESGERFVPPPSGPQVEALDEDAVAAMWKAYRSEARHLDHALRQLWQAVEERRRVDLAVFTADHGEEFLDHGGTRHGPTVLPEVSRVPLWVGGVEAEKLARRLERAGVGPDTPVTLRDVGTLLLDPQRWVPSGPATVESRVHGPPRFAWVDATRHWSFASRWMSARPPEDDIEAWLRGQPEIYVDPEERPPDGAGAVRWRPGDLDELAESWTQVPDDTWLAVIEQLSGLAPGRWVFWRRTSEIDGLDRSSVDASAWALGSCDHSFVARSAPVTAATDGPCIQFLGDDVAAPFDHDPLLRRWVLNERPDRLPPDGALSWVEAPRDRAVPQDVERTMERLRALGYIQ